MQAARPPPCCASTATTGAITLFGEEPIAPYQRPPLSKAWLKGEADAESLALKPQTFYAEHDIDLRLDVRVVSIDRAAKAVVLRDGETIAYDVLILATGARARRLNLPGADLRGILELRTAADAEMLKRALAAGKTLAIVGGGYIGLEAAASARALGAEAVVIEVLPRVLARVASRAAVGLLPGLPPRPRRQLRAGRRRRRFRRRGGPGHRRQAGRRSGDRLRRGAGRRRRHAQRGAGPGVGPRLRQRRGRRPRRAHLRSGDLRHRRRHQPADAAL